MFVSDDPSWEDRNDDEKVRQQPDPHSGRENAFVRARSVSEHAGSGRVTRVVVGGGGA